MAGRSASALAEASLMAGRVGEGAESNALSEADKAESKGLRRTSHLNQILFLFSQRWHRRLSALPLHRNRTARTEFQVRRPAHAQDVDDFSFRASQVAA